MKERRASQHRGGDEMRLGTWGLYQVFLSTETSLPKVQFFVAVYVPLQTNAGTKTALNKLNKAKSKQENAHPEVVLLVMQDNFNLFYLTSSNAGKLQSVLPFFLPACYMCNSREKKL